MAGMDDLIRRSAYLGGSLLAVVFVTSLIPGPPGSIIQGFSVLLALFAYAVLSSALVVGGLARAWQLRTDWRRSLLVGIGVPAILAGALFLTVPTLAFGNRLYIWGMVTLGRGWLDQAVAEAQQVAFLDPRSRITRRGGFIPYYIDAGPPVRIAFETNAGFLDNWSGIVFDPTGQVMQARGWDAAGNFYAPPEVTKLFYGDIVECRPLVARYYYCSFT